MLRLTSPAHPTRTVDGIEVVIGDYVFPAGERLHMPLAAANRDPVHFPKPDEVIFNREGKAHLSFGLGPHRCLGVHLARTELHIGFEEWHRRMPTFQLDGRYEPHDEVGLVWNTSNVHLLFPPGKRERTGRLAGPSGLA
jgi:cytochrome P450